MSNRKKQRIVIGTLCTIVVGMVVGYAALNQILNITGTSGITGDFNIQFTKVEEEFMGEATTISKGGVGTTEANFTVDLEKPGSMAVYALEITNTGTMNAVLIGIDGIEEANNTEPTDIMIALGEAGDGDVWFEDPTNLNVPLKAGESVTYYVEVYWNYDATSIPTTIKNFSLKLNYGQKTSSYIANPDIAGSYLIKNKVESDVPAGGNGLVAIDNTGEITTSTTPREYRYIGSNPDNYVKFNNELWRIIGIFDGQLKIIRKDSLGEMAWDKDGSDGGTHGDYGWNDWSQATLQNYLNGDYLNSIDSTSQGMISSHIWSLGGSKTDNDVTAQLFYERERGAEVYTGRPTEWTGKVALMYPSDYGFSTSGGSTTIRSSCLMKELRKWRSVSDCYNNSWLYDSSGNQWTLAPYASSNSFVFYVSSDGNVYREDYNEYPFLGVRPSLFLSSSVEITSGTGQDSDPFILKG